MWRRLKRLVVYATTDTQTDDIVRQRRFMMTAGVYVAAGLVFSFFFLMHLVQGNGLLLMLNSVFLLAVCVCSWLLYRKRIMDLPLWITGVGVAGFILWLIWTDQNRTFSLGWTFLFPVFLVPLMGYRIGGIASLIFLLLVNFLSWSGVGAWNYGNWETLSAIRVTILSVFFYGLTLLVEASYLRTARRLQLSKAREKQIARNLRHRAVTDALTGLHNRRYFDERLDEEFARIRRNQGCSGLLLLDIDHFKSINDNFGHLEGDKVLVRVGDVLKRMVRESDVVARWGGEEYAILLTGSDLAQSRDIGEKIRKAIEHTTFDVGCQVTLSIGVGEIIGDDTVHGRGKDIVLGQTDRSLYGAKNMGRNQIGPVEG